MDYYGRTFRAFREQKGYTMRQVAEGIVSISFLSKFERGDSDISLSLFIQLLDRLFVTFEEFQFLHKNNNVNKLELFFHKADTAFLNQDLKKLARLKTEELKKWEITKIEPFRCNSIMINVYESIILHAPSKATEEDIQFLHDYLFKVEVWGYYELYLYNSTVLMMTPEMVIHLSDIVYKNSEKMKENETLYKVITRIMLNTLIYLTGGQDSEFLYKQECKLFFSYLKDIGISESDLQARNELFYLRGLYYLKLGKQEKGTALIEESIQTLKSLGAEKTAKFREDYFKLVLERM